MRQMIASLIRRPTSWLIALFLWTIILFISSSFAPELPEVGLKIPHSDKAMHFAYFLIGAFIFTTYILLNTGLHTSKQIRFLIPIVILAIIGLLDEYHQTFTPGRLGNDPFDLLANLVGTITGTTLANLLHPRIKFLAPPMTEKS